MAPPFYVHIPSVRKSITGCLEKWFVHAIEARAGLQEREKIFREIDSLAKSRETPAEARRAVQKIGNRLKARNLLGTVPFGSEIHFVVADSAAFYHEKPVEETHTPQAVELARTLNRLGNRHGIYVHYITPNEMTMLPDVNEMRLATTQHKLPPRVRNAFLRKKVSDFPFWSPFAHIHDGRIKIGPGEGMNIALSYIRALHEPEDRVFFLRMDDDTIPLSAQAEFPTWLFMPDKTRNVKSRNFFHDQQTIIDGKPYEDRTYRGYKFGLYGPLRLARGSVCFFTTRSITLSKTRYCDTGRTGDVNQAFRSTENIGTPSLIHAGGISVIGQEHFGNYGIRRDAIQPAPSRLVKAVKKKSGISRHFK